LDWPLADKELALWAREHLVYEGRMLAFTAVRLAERQGIPADPLSNALLESFTVHVRCLRDFLWGHRASHQMDAFASDFCEPGLWESARAAPSPALDHRGPVKQRIGREVVHLSYERLAIEAEAKTWSCGAIFEDFAFALDHFASTALPARLDDATRTALEHLCTHSSDAGSPSVATGAAYGLPFTGATTAFPGFEVGS
jgi:hypothetical protein